MPRLVDYPRASFKKSVALAEAVSYLGGSCTLETCADKLGMVMGGGFKALYGAARKYELVSVNKGLVSTTELFKLIRHAYTPEEKRQMMMKAFLSPMIFGNLYEKFAGRELPVEMLDKILIREYEVDQDLAARISRYFLDGCKELEMLDASNILQPQAVPGAQVSDKEPEKPTTSPAARAEEAAAPANATATIQANGSYVVRITGPGVNFELSIREEDDIMLLEAMIKKIRKKIAEDSE